MFSFLEVLPEVALKKIISNLSLKDVLNLSSTCHLMYNVRRAYVSGIALTLTIFIYFPFYLFNLKKKHTHTQRFAIQTRYGNLFSLKFSARTARTNATKGFLSIAIGSFCAIKFLKKTSRNL
jgi:F-box domain